MQQQQLWPALQVTGRERRTAPARCWVLLLAHPLLVGCLAVGMAGGYAAASTGPTTAGPTLTLWLMPVEPAVEDDPGERQSLPDQVQTFNERLGIDQCPVTVLNTTVPSLRDQLLAWEPEFANPNWAVIRGQRGTLAALCRFARTQQVAIDLRFVRWGQAFHELRTVLPPRQRGQCAAAPQSQAGGRDGTAQAPNVVQIGSTWTAYFAQQQQLLPWTEAADGLAWRSLPALPRATLRYTTDVRLLFYWKRLPTAPPPSEAWLHDVPTWEALLEALAARVLQHSPPSPPMVMPSGLTLNLLHDFVPLVWAGESPFLRKNALGVHSALTDAAALRIPLLLARHASQRDAAKRPLRLLAFPEMGHEEAARHFLRGSYVAFIEPVGFIKRWHAHFRQEASTLPENFWDYAGVTVPPHTFKGGSDLMIVCGTQESRQAFALARFLATDPAYTRLLAEHGALPAQYPDLGVDALLAALGDATHAGAATLRAAVRRAVDQGQEYPLVAEWPVAVESPEVLEALQRLLRRIGEGKESKIQAAAAETNRVINRRLYWPTWLWETATLSWRLLAPPLLLLLLGVSAFRRRLKHRERLLRVAIEVLRRRDYVLIARAGAFIADCHRMDAARCSEFSARLAELRTRTLQLENDIRADLTARGRRSRPVGDLLEGAWQNAVSQYRVASLASAGPGLNRKLTPGLTRWQLCRLPYIMSAIVQEWFYNCMRDCTDTPRELTVDLWYRGHRLQGIRVISPEPTTALASGPGPRAAFTLINDLCRAAFGRRLESWWLTEDEQLILPGEQGAAGLRSVLLIPLPMTQRNKKESSDAGALDRR